MALSNTDQELQRRDDMWAAAIQAGGPTGLTSSQVRELGFYSGGRGVWMNKEVTDGVAPDGGAVAVGLLHTGRVYADDLSSDGVLYHYPVTDVPGRDKSEIASMKAAGQLELPVFVVTTNLDNASLRDVQRGWIQGWDDGSQLVLVAFQNAPPTLETDVEELEEDFELVGPEADATPQMVVGRPGQSRFKFRVLQRYGSKCLFCGVDVPQLLDAAHIRDKRHHGSDDPRNGLVLCALHHRALDRGLLAIDPDSLEIVSKDATLTLERLGVTTHTLAQLPRKPHAAALQWRWDQSIG